MALYFDRVKETSITTGTGNVTVAGAAVGYRAIDDVLTVGQEAEICIAGQTSGVPAEWEVSLCTYLGANVFSRDTVIASSNAGALVNFSAGTKDVFITFSGDAIQTIVDHPGTGGSAHALATTVTAGFMSAADKTALDNSLTRGKGHQLIIGNY